MFFPIKFGVFFPSRMRDLWFLFELRVFVPSRKLKSTPDLLRDQRELGSSENPTELIYSILKEG